MAFVGVLNIYVCFTHVIIESGTFRSYMNLCIDFRVTILKVVFGLGTFMSTKSSALIVAVISWLYIFCTAILFCRDYRNLLFWLLKINVYSWF